MPVILEIVDLTASAIFNTAQHDSMALLPIRAGASFAMPLFLVHSLAWPGHVFSMFTAASALLVSLWVPLKSMVCKQNCAALLAVSC